MRVLVGTFAAASLLIVLTIAVRSSANSQSAAIAPGQEKAGNVTEARVIAEKPEGKNWLVLGGAFGQEAFSPLEQITDKNIGSLGFAWAVDIYSPMGMSSEPIIVDGVIYVSAARSLVYAVDAVSGKVLWTFDPKVRVDCWRCSFSARANRGVAVWAGKVYVGTGDCRLVAMNAASGKQLWEARVCDPNETGITGAPQVGSGKVFIGYYGGDTGVRGSIPAFDAETGKELWRFWTVPGDPAKGFESKALEMAAKTWTGDQWWRVGGSADWDPITYDAETGLLFIGTSQSNPGHLFGDMAGYPVGGDRLFSGSVIAIRADTGEYVWHYQTTPKAENFHILVTDLVIDGQKRRVAMSVPRNGVFQVLDAKTGQLISAKRLTDGRAVPASTSAASGPPPGAGHNWWHMSYSPLTGLVYVPAYDARRPTGSGQNNPPLGKLFAWDPIGQSARWTVEQPLSVNGGVVSTAGNLVFQGEATGEFSAYTADTGRKVWSIKTGSAIQATPVTFTAKGEQYIVVPVGFGSASRNFNRGSNLGTPESKRGPSRLLAFKLGAKTPFPVPQVLIPPVPRPPTQTFSAEMIRKGEPLYTEWFCAECHSPQADGSGAWTMDGAIPDLRYMPSSIHDQWNVIVMKGSRSRNGMPGFEKPPGFPLITKKMTQEVADAIHAYVIDQAWKAYNEDQSRLNATRKR